MKDENTGAVGIVLINKVTVSVKIGLPHVFDIRQINRVLFNDIGGLEIFKVFVPPALKTALPVTLTKTPLTSCNH